MKSAVPERTSIWKRIGPAMSQPGAFPCNGSPAGEEPGVAVAKPVRCAGAARAPGAAMRVWRRKSPVLSPDRANPSNGVPADEVSDGSGAGAVLGQTARFSRDAAVTPGPEAAMEGGERRRRQRRRPRFCQPTASSSNVDPAPSASMSVAPPEAPILPVQSPPCIISWDDRMARAEEDLAHAVIVTVCGAEPLALAREVAEVLAIRLNVEAGSLVLRQASSSSYLLVLPDISLVERLMDQRLPPICSPAFTLLCKRWSRLAGASGRSLPWLVDLELQGIPAHVWETSIVEQFLNPLACIQQVHLETIALRDLSTFRCSAWCIDPAALPTTKELWVTEPPVTSMEAPSVKRLLSYPIGVKCSILLGPGAPPPPPPPAGDGDDGGDDSPARPRGGIVVPRRRLMPLR